MPRAFMPGPPEPVYFAPDISGAIRAGRGASIARDRNAIARDRNALYGSRTRLAEQENALDRQSAEDKQRMAQQAAVAASFQFDSIESAREYFGDDIHPFIEKAYSTDPVRANILMPKISGQKAEKSLERIGQEAKAKRAPGKVWMFNPKSGMKDQFSQEEIESKLKEGWKRGQPVSATKLKMNAETGELEFTQGVDTGKEGNVPLSLADLTRLQHPETKKAPPLGTTAAQAKELGYKVQSQAEEKQSVKLRAATAVVGRIKAQTDSIWGYLDENGKNVPGIIDVEGGLDRYLSAPEVLRQKLMQQVDISLLESSKKGFASLMMKALGEERVTDADVERGYALLPKVSPIPDRREVVERKIGQLLELFQDIAGRKLKEKQGNLPKKARIRLREGKNTTFENGQVWTLIKGTPVQVK